MESRVGTSHGTDISKKRRSLDLKSVYESSKGAEVGQSSKIKRKRRSVDDGGVGGDDKRKRGRKSVSSFNSRNVNKSNGSSKSIEEVYNGSLNSHLHNLKQLKTGSFKRLADNGGGFKGVSAVLENNAVKVPRRKRGFVGRRKGDEDAKVEARLDDEVNGGGEADHNVNEENISKPVKNGKKVKLKKSCDEFKENCCGESSKGNLKEEEACAGHSDVNNKDASLKKSHVDDVAGNGGSSSRNLLKRRKRKRKDLVTEGKSVKKNGELSIDTSAKISGGLQDEDEENLEENAARMLSSRFATSCGGFSSNSKTSALSSANGSSFLPKPGKEFVSRSPAGVSGSDSTSVDTAARVLRPRKQHGEKGSSRKRRHYYEILPVDLDVYWVLNRQIKVFWPLDKSWYYGLVGEYDKERNLHHVKYDDRDEEWINLQNERFKLLLLPSEVPGKTPRKRRVSRKKQAGEVNKKTEASKENSRKLTTNENDDSHARNCMDSEPIISWLARSAQRAKCSPPPVPKKPKTCNLSSTSEPQFLTKKTVDRRKGLGGFLTSSDGRRFSFNSDLSGKADSSRRSDGSAMESLYHPSDTKVPLVYYRRRFRKKRNASQGAHISGFLPDSGASPAPFLASFEAWQKRSLIDVDKLGLLCNGEVALNLHVPLVGSKKFILGLGVPALSALSSSICNVDIRLFRDALLLRYGTLMTIWPRVHLEMLVVDNVAGLRFILFEGCLNQALAFVFLVLSVFDQPNMQESYADLQLPATSIRFKFSRIQDFGKQLVLAFYNFCELGRSKWISLDTKMKKHCVFTRQLPLSECTYDAIKALQSETRLLPSPPHNIGSVPVKVMKRSARHCMNLMEVSKESNHANASHRNANSDKEHIHLPPFTPTFFMGLHLKLLSARSVDHFSFLDHYLIEHQETSGSFLGGGSSNRCLKNTVGNNLKAFPVDGKLDGCVSGAKSAPQTVSVSVCLTGGEVESPPNDQNGGTCVETCATTQGTGKLENIAVVPMRKRQCHQSELKQHDLLQSPSIDREKSNAGSHPSLNGITVEIPSCHPLDKNVDKGLQGAQQSNDLILNMNGGLIPSPNPTARRSTWHRNRSSSTSFGSLAGGWSDGRTDSLLNNFGNGPKRPRTQVSYALPCGNFDDGSKNKNYQQKGLPHKRIRMPTEKRLSEVSIGSGRNFESLSCDANVLVTVGDRGWRECGAQVVMELLDHNEWKLAVKISGSTKYSYKALQVLQPGSANRHTHAMMWKGGKDWTLEFPDRSQWALFKEMHEECYNRNVRAASVKHIPIPGVRLVEDEDNISEVRFVRSSKYFQQVETDAEMALASSRVLYDLDSDDEEWILKNGKSQDVDGCSSWEISEDFFEKIMTMFEKAAFSQKRDQFMPDEIINMTTGLGPPEAIKSIHDYWQMKRQKEGMPLIRHLQPPLWEKYQQAVKEWERATAKSGSSLSNGCHGKVAPLIKPPMFAFCMKPRGLEVPNKGSKQRSHRRFSVSGKNNNFSGDHDGFHAYGRRLNGFAFEDERAVHPGYFEDLDESQMSHRACSSREAGITGYFSMSSNTHDRNLLHDHYRSKSKKLGTFRSPIDQMAALRNPRMYGQRNGGQKWNSDFSEWPRERQYQLHGLRKRGPEPLDGSDLDASEAALHAREVAKFKRERAQRLLYKADLLIHRAVVSLTTAEAMKAASEDLNGDG